MSGTLELVGIRHHYGGLRVLEGVDLRVAQGERHAIIGPNGAGKSTLFHILGGTLKPAAGKVLFGGRDLTLLAPCQIARNGVGRSFQVMNIFPNCTVRASVEGAILSRRGARLGVWRRAKTVPGVADEAQALIEQMGLARHADTPAGELSYGEQREVEIALTAALRPSLFLLDEPMAGLSGQEAPKVVALIKRITEGCTLMLVEHDMDVVFDIADRVSVLHFGRLIATGTPEEVRANRDVQEAYLGEVEHDADRA